MLRGVYAPTDFVSRDRDPSISPVDKLRVIDSSPSMVHPLGKRATNFIVRLPFTDGAVFEAGLCHDGVYSEHVNVGDVALYGHGIGSRLLRSGLRHAVELQSGKSTRFITGWARLGLVNTVVSVLGEENVKVRLENGTSYGWQTEQPLGDIFDAQPPVVGEKYLVAAIVANIDPELVMSWEPPQTMATDQQRQEPES
jgi:hypothetical protein